MDLPESSNGTDKSWDRPWTTDEMRQNRREWSLAADAGLLEHLKQFSDNLMENVEKTKEKLNSLTSDLNETSVIVDNITNASLALANTQFIESRVREDDIETKKSQNTDNEKINGEELKKEDMIGSVIESIKQGLNVMDEKFQRWEVVASDSEDEGETPIPSVVLRPKDPYQNRPLPYVIGSEKWKASSKVGLESSSSDSEPPEAEEESASPDDEKILQSDMMVNNRRESLMRRSSSTSSDSSDRNERGNTVEHYSGVGSRTDKLAARSQDTLNSGSEIATPTVTQSGPQNFIKGAPSFAEELAKRLGNVLPSTNSSRNSQEVDQASINRSKDDLFGPDNDDVFAANSENPFTHSGNLFDAEVSSSLWKDRPIRVPKTNIIPPCLDVPPPIHDDASKPRSAFDDLCGDADSEDSDDIFARKPSPSYGNHKPSPTAGILRQSEDSRENKFLKIVQGDSATNMATSTPETNDNGGMFGDASEGDDDDLFGDSVKSSKKMTEGSPERSRTAVKPKTVGLPITQADILSSNLGSRLFQRVPRRNSTDSSDSEISMPNADARLDKTPIADDDSNRNSGVSNHNKSEPSSIVAGNAHSFRANVEDSDSSGISVRPNSTGNTFGLGADFQPQSESTRLRSEEIYRERVVSDSLFATGTRPLDVTNSTNNSINRPREVRVTDTLDSHPEEDFDSDDVFGPPPLPKSDFKSKSEASSVDDLFLNVSSGSRSQKSSDLLAAAAPQSVVKSSGVRNRGLFDEDIDIFGTGDVPDLDIFSEGFATTLTSKKANVSSLESQRASSKSSGNKSPDLFSTEPIEPVETFPWGNNPKPSARKPHSIFDDSEDDDDDDDLFGTSFLKRDRKPVDMPKSDDDNLFGNTRKGSSETVVTAPKKDSIGEVGRTAGANESATKPDGKRDGDVENTTARTMPSYPSGGLFDDLNDDDDDSLFGDNKVKLPEEKSTSTEGVKKSAERVQDFGESKTEELTFESKSAKLEGLFKNQRSPETLIKKSGGKEGELADAGDNELPNKRSPSPSPKKKSAEISPKKLFDAEKRKEDEISTTDGAKISKSRGSPEVSGGSTKRVPPKTLSIRLPIPSGAEDSGQAPRRVVSSKIKNLTEKMGDLKYLSPTDTPPLWRKTETKPDVDDESTESRDSEDGSSVSLPKAKTPPEIFSEIEDSGMVAEKLQDPPPISPHDDSGNSESAVSFDIPAQVETLTVTASKSRARIQAKRRPQSRHARQSALRKSGIDFDTMDTSSADAGESDPSDNTMSGISDKIPTVVTDSVDNPKTRSGSDRLLAEADNEKGSTDKPAEPSSSLAPDDRSEMSMSKGSSMSINKNTLLSPSTDEEDLFDVPPDLPEDPPKEDTIFGRAPILSPIDGFPGSKHRRTKDRSRGSRLGLGAPESNINADKDTESVINVKSSKKNPDAAKSDDDADTTNAEDRKSNEKEIDADNDLATNESLDPLRDTSHDPLNDPSQLFAFVTKTPSPEKGQNVLFEEDDSLFTRVTNKSAEKIKTPTSKKPVLDLFADDPTADLFSVPNAKSPKNSAKVPRSSGLFDDIDADDDGASDLFGSGARSKLEKSDEIDDAVGKKRSAMTDRALPGRRSSIFADDADVDIFVDPFDEKVSPELKKKSTENPESRLFPATSKVAKDSKFEDLFGDQSSGEDDIFVPKKIIGSGKASGTGSLFSADTDDEDVTDIFGNKSTEKSRRVEPIENRTSVKKSVTRDLKKTAEKIVGDPLSMLQDD